MQSALFLDLGGTLVRTVDDEIYVGPGGMLELLPGVAATLDATPFDVVLVVTNQSGIGRGARTTDDVRGWIDQLNAHLGGIIADYWATPFVESAYRKPSPEMVLGLADKHFVDLGRSLFVGDSETDRACAEAAGVRFAWAHEFFRRRRAAEG